VADPATGDPETRDPATGDPETGDFDDGDIYGFWATCRRDDPVMAIEGLGQEMRMVTRFADVDEVLRDPERFPSRINADTMGPVMGTVILAMDGDEHRRYRNLVARAFRPSALVRWEDELIAPTIHRLLDTIADRGRADLVADVTSRYPVQVIAGVLGVPTDDYELFQRWGLEISMGPEDYDVSKAASKAMRDYLTPLVEQRKTHPGDDLVSDIVTAEIDGERLSDEHIYGFLRLLLPAGAETTFRALGNCLVALLSRPPVLARVRDDRSLLDTVIEETLRWETSSSSTTSPSPPGSRWSSPPARPTTTRPATTTARPGTSIGRPPPTSLSAPVATSAWGCTWPASSCASDWRPSSTGSPVCASTPPPTRPTSRGRPSAPRPASTFFSTPDPDT
jgi:cytochrome P450